MKRRRRCRDILFLLLLMIVSINAVAFMQAWSMSHFVAGGARTPAPEELSICGKLWVLATGVRTPRPINLHTPADFNLTFQTGHVHESKIDLEVWYIPAKARSRGLVLMYHAYVTSKESLLPAAVQFHQMGYAVEMVDFRSSGGSSGNSTTVGYREADDVLATVSDARRNHLDSINPLILYGQSMGAAAVLRAVGDLGVCPDAIILESPYDRLLSTAGNRFHTMHLPAFPLAQILVFWGGVQQGYWGFDMNPVDSATRVRCPTLLFQGQLDPRVTTAQATSIYNNLAGPKQFELYPDTGHLAFLMADPARWSGTVSAFLGQYADKPKQWRMCESS